MNEKRQMLRARDQAASTIIEKSDSRELSDERLDAIARQLFQLQRSQFQVIELFLTPDDPFCIGARGRKSKSSER